MMEELQQIEDMGGNTLTVLNYNGRLYPDFPREAIKGVATFNARPDDVIVCAYPKSGTHWMWEMVRILLAGTTDVPAKEKDDAMIELTVPDDLEKISSPRSLNTHVHFELLPPAVMSKRCRIIYVTRDPRDVAVSYFHHHRKLEEYYKYHGQWHDYLPLFLQGKVDYESWFAYTKGWEQGIKDHPELPVLVTSYEALHEDTLTELKRLATFLNITVDDLFLRQVMQKCSFDTMRNTKGNVEVSPNGTPIMYRKGKVGDWKNNFTVTEAEQFNQAFEQEMPGTQAYKLYSIKSRTDINQNGVVEN